jgi:hypothetical protein
MKMHPALVVDAVVDVLLGKYSARLLHPAVRGIHVANAGTLLLPQVAIADRYDVENVLQLPLFQELVPARDTRPSTRKSELLFNLAPEMLVEIIEATDQRR